MFDDGTPVPAMAPGETSHEILVSRQLERIQAQDEAQRLYDAARVQGQHEPVELRPYLDGAIKRPEPTYGIRIEHGGPRLLYPGLEHAVVGEMESGKSWFAAACVAAEMRGLRRVVYLHFEEADPMGLLDQVKVCGAHPDDLAEWLSFVGVDEPRGIAKLIELRPSVVILDGVNEAMSLYGHKIREEDGAAAFRRQLVKPFTAIGAAVLCCDHVTKDGDTRGRYALGSIHKGNAINGAAFMLENVIPYGRGQRGMSRLFVVKDRPGFLRQHGSPGKLAGKTWLGDMVIDMRLDAPAEAAGLTVYPARPAPDRPMQTPEERLAIANQQLDEQVFAAVVDIIDRGREANTNTITAVVAGRRTRVVESLGRLSYGLEPKLTAAPGPNRSVIYTRLVLGESGTGDAVAGVPGESGPGPYKEGAPDAPSRDAPEYVPDASDAARTHRDTPRKRKPKGS